MVQEELKKVEGVSVDQIPHLVRTLGPILMKEAERKNQSIVLGTSRPPGPLTDTEKAKMDFLTNVKAVLAPEAAALIDRWVNAGAKFSDTIMRLPELFYPAPELIAQFRLLMERKVHKEILFRLSKAMKAAHPFLVDIGDEHLKTICHDIAALIMLDTLPSPHSATREFVYYACAGLVEAGTTLPKIAGAPHLRTSRSVHAANSINKDSSHSAVGSTSTLASSPSTHHQPSSSSSGGLHTPMRTSSSSAMMVDPSPSSTPLSPPNTNSSIIASTPSVPRLFSSSMTQTSPLSAASAITPSAAGSSSAVNNQTSNTAGPGTPVYRAPPSSCGPSYTQRPASYVPPTCSSRDALGDSVLNDYFHCAGAGSEGSPQAHDYIRNNSQEALFRLEEDALCLDILIGRAQSTVRVLAEITRRLELLSKHGSVTFSNIWGRNVTLKDTGSIINASLLPTHIETFKLIIKTRTSMPVDPVAHFIGDPQRFSTEMTRLIMFHADENGRARQAFGKLWRQVFARQYLPSLDHRVYRMKYDEKYIVNSKAVLAIMSARYLELLSAGREWSVDYLEALDFSHYRYSVLPALTATKSERYKQEQPPKKKRKNAQNDIESIDSNIIPDEVLQRLEGDILNLLVVGGERILHKSEAAEMETWMTTTFNNFIRRPEARNWDSSYVHVPNNFYGPPQLAVVVKMYHTLHERMRLAFALAHTFDGHCWDFSITPRPEPPSKKKIPAPSKHFPLYDTVAGPDAPPAIHTDFDENPPTPLFELSTFYCDSNPNYISSWEAETAGVGQRLTRSGAISSTSNLLSGAPPPYNTMLTNTLLRQAASLRNTAWPANPFSSNPVETESGEGYDVNDTAPASLPPLQDPAFVVDNAQRYPLFLQLVGDMLNGKLTTSSYELGILKLLGVEAYPLYSLHRLITNLVSAIRTMMTLPGRQIWYELFRDHRLALLKEPPMSQEALDDALTAYRSAAYLAAGPNKFAEFDVSCTGCITYHFRQVFPRGGRRHGAWPPKSSRTPADWEAYITSWNSSRPEYIRLNKRRVFLQRNITNQLPEEVRGEPLLGRLPSWNQAQALSTLREKRQFVSYSGPTFATIDPETYRFLLDPESPDVWSISKTRKSIKTRSKCAPDNANSKLHRLMTKISQPKEEDSAPDADSVKQAIQLVESIVAAELARPDLETPSETASEPFETVSSRTRNSVAVNGNGSDDESDGISAISEVSDHPSPEPEGSSYADDESVRMLVD